MKPLPHHEHSSPDPSSPLGIIGLGLLGSALAERALVGDLTVLGCDPDPSRRAQLEQSGGRVLAPAREVARACRRILLVLPNDGMTREVMQEIAPVLTPGTIILDATTRPLPTMWLPMKAGGVLALAFCLLTGCGKVEPKVLTDFPAHEAPNYQGLVSVSWLKGLLDYQKSGFQAPRPATYRNERFAIIEASWATLDKAKDYRHGHIPGAIHFNTDDLEDGSPRWRLREAEELQRAIGRAGITPDTTVIVYGGKLIAAARVWWALKYAGVADARLLDGGFEAWAEAGYPVEKEVRLPQPVEFAAPVAANLLATTDYIRERLQNSSIWLGDVRSVEEFSGRTSGYSYLEAKCRIPSAAHVGDGDDGSYLYKQRDGRLKPPAEILAHWQRQGIVAAKKGGRFEREVVFYCGGGWRSSVAFFYAWLLGFENVRNYSDGWSGWSTEYHADPAAKGRTPGWRQQPSLNPIEAGAP